MVGADRSGELEMIAASEWHFLLYGLVLVASLFGKAQYSRMTHKHEDEVRRAEKLGLQPDDADAAAHPPRIGLRRRVKPMDFVQALKHGRWPDVTTGPDFDRITETFIDAINRGVDGALIGFALPGRPTRVVWADVEVSSAGVVPPEELPAGIPRGTKAFDLRLAGLAFLEHSDAEPSELRPPRFAERPWFLTDYPGRVSWAELRQSSEVVLGSPN
jgi:hypothetical protein